jgi:DNA adenine methylase
MILRPALRYFGGKWRIAPWIISHFPAHISYVEPYCGAASVLLRKPPAEIETINDLDGDVVCFFKTLREHSEALIRTIELTPYSRAEYANAYLPTEDPIERARRYYVRSWFGRGGMRKESGGGWRFMVTDSRGGSVVDDWRRIGHLRQIVERLQMVQVENGEALDIIKRYDTPNTLFYVDPPYVMQCRSERWQRAYFHEMTDMDHELLANCLQAVKGMVIISGYPSELYDRLYAGWKCETKADRKENLKASVECLWISPNAEAKLSQKELF